MSEIVIIRRLEQAEQDIQRLKGEINKSPLRIEPSMFSTKEVRWAICTEDAPDDRRWIWANLLDSSGNPITEGEEADIKVYCNVFGPDEVMLKDCVPWLEDDPDGNWPMPIVQKPFYNDETSKTEMRWECLWWFNKGRECVCNEPEEP